MTPYKRELLKLEGRDFTGPLSRGMTPLELAKVCESARAVCESSDEMPSFHDWCSARGIPHQSATALVEKFAAGGFDGKS